MPTVTVAFEFLTGLSRPLFRNVRLEGSWDADGRPSAAWSSWPMEEIRGADGCPAWRAEVAFDAAAIGATLSWGLRLDGPAGTDRWAIAEEHGDFDAPARHRTFVLGETGSTERHRFVDARRYGANKLFRPGVERPAIRYAVFAPNARAVETVIGDPIGGYVWNDGRGIVETFTMSRDADGVWSTDPDEPALADFAAWDHRPYMFRITRDDGSMALRTDLFSRCQIGSGRQDPAKELWSGRRQDLAGMKSCSVVVDPEQVTTLFAEPNFPEVAWSSEAEFWANEFDPLRPLPTRLEDMVIYELWTGGLGPGGDRPGTLADAIDLLDHLVELGINAVELLPMTEFEGFAGFGYGSSHYYAIEYTGGGRDQLKHFVRACHRRGIAVIADVVYNHFAPIDAERAEWMYDSTAHDRNFLYWYEGRPEDYPSLLPTGGYLDNGSTGFTPNFRSEHVRRMLIGSAVVLASEFHVDGFRMDLTQALHRDARLHLDGRSIGEANAAGARFMREWVRTLRMVKPDLVLIAEDHTGWAEITRPQAIGGIGFDATWVADWYHHLIGDATNDPHRARLLATAGTGWDGPLAMSRLAALIPTDRPRVIYHESHDEAGNSSYDVPGGKIFSARTLVTAVDGRLDAGSRPWAEARVRTVAGLTLLAPGTPMVFMGEEVGAVAPVRWDGGLDARDDLLALKAGSGAPLFRFFRDAIALRRSSRALRGLSGEVLAVDDAARLLVIGRAEGDDEFVVVVSLANHAVAPGREIRHPRLDGRLWRVVLNGDAAVYGGFGHGESGVIDTRGRPFAPRLGPASLTVFRRIG